MGYLLSLFDVVELLLKVHFQGLGCSWIQFCIAARNGFYQDASYIPSEQERPSHR